MLKTDARADIKIPTVAHVHGPLQAAGHKSLQGWQDLMWTFNTAAGAVDAPVAPGC